MSVKAKILVGTGCAAVILVLMLIGFYVKVLPQLVSNPKVINFTEKKVSELAKIDLKITNPRLVTGFSPIISFSSDEIKIFKDSAEILIIDKLDTEISLKEIFNKKIIVDKFGLDYVYADINKLMSLVPKQKEEKKKQENEWDIDLYDSILSLNKSLIVYSPAQDTMIKLAAGSLNIDNTQKIKRFIHFDIAADIKKGGENLSFAIEDKNKVFIQNRHLYVKDCVLDINKSNIHIDAEASKKDGFKSKISAEKFKVSDVIDIVGSNLFINNGSEIISYFKDMSGDFNFTINLTKTAIDGVVDINRVYGKLIPLSNLPLTLNKGHVDLNSNEIVLKDFEGFYGSGRSNKVKIFGSIKDYTNSCDTDITILTIAANELAKDYLSKLTGVSLSIAGNAGTVINVKSVFNKIDVKWGSKLAKGEDILVEGASLSPTNYDRAFTADLHFENNILDIKNISYYIASEIKRGVKIKPVLTLNGKFDCSKPVPIMQAMGFDIPRPLPSEFLNVLIGQKLFRGGKFAGELSVVNEGSYPIVKGRMTAENVRIPSQRVSIKNAELHTDSESIFIKADGRYKRSKYNFTGNIANGIKYPIVVKNVEFGLDSIDVEKLMASFNQQNTAAIKDIPVTNDTEPDDDAVVFDVNNLIIEKCVLKLQSGKYKDIEFGNVNADLTLNKDNILELQSNKFDIAEGISTLKVHCDLKKHLYNIRLGIKEVNSDIMSTSLLNLPREISGKASGLIELNTDNSLKLNGKIQFLVKDGQIQKIGLVQYVLNFASIFRNPVAMLSPTVISDMINIPEGKFEDINGVLIIKNNVVELLKIKSHSPTLSSFIIGRYNIENSDAILRIYTKFSNKNKGFAGALRNISLNSLANRIPLNSRNDAHYYEVELSQLPPIDADEKDCQIFLTKVDGDVEHNNFLSSLKKIK